MARSIKFGSILSDLIERKGKHYTRKKIAGELDLSVSLLSQYESNSTTPSFDKLIMLAEYFGVTLDYLVFGESPADSKGTGQILVDATYRFMDEKLESMSVQAERRQWLLAKLSNVIVSRLDRAVDRLLDGGSVQTDRFGIPGFIDDQTTLTLEKHAREVCIFTTDFSYDVFINEEGEVVPGKFFHLVAENIRERNCDYRFLLPKGRDWSRHVDGFFRLLREAAGPAAIARCQCVVAERTLISGLGIYKLDLKSLNSDAPAVYHQVVDHIKETQIAYIIPPSKLVHGDLLIAREYTSSTSELFEEAWREGLGKKVRKRNASAP
ncbi:MAG: helix-turn-helix transcriptional regulator [Proteobacteria bacterium]|nr:helix-turn-helix transcriptional regulator [Pseudomonadota bacterium]